MPLTGNYVTSPHEWVRQQVEAIETAGNTSAASIMDRPIVLVTIRGKTSGNLRKVPLMRVEHDGVYAAVASRGGAPTHPTWYWSITANPQVMVQDGTQTQDMIAREIHGEERALWWERCVEAFPPYADYAVNAADAERVIPVLLCEPAPHPHTE